MDVTEPTGLFTVSAPVSLATNATPAIHASVADASAAGPSTRIVPRPSCAVDRIASRDRRTLLPKPGLPLGPSFAAARASSTAPDRNAAHASDWAKPPLGVAGPDPREEAAEAAAPLAVVDLAEFGHLVSGIADHAGRASGRSPGSRIRARAGSW
jgi:hypothetical protein